MIGFLSGCGDLLRGEDAGYGVPPGVNLDVPCPANGTWATPVLASRSPTARTSRPTEWEAKVVMHDWTVDIYETEWENTGLCTDVIVGGMAFPACDYEPVLTGRVKRGYIDPGSGAPDSNGDTRYAGMTTDGDELRFWDFTVPTKVYLNFKYAGSTFWQIKTLYPY